jgi:polyphosphate glucokinase
MTGEHENGQDEAAQGQIGEGAAPQVVTPGEPAELEAPQPSAASSGEALPSEQARQPEAPPQAGQALRAVETIEVTEAAQAEATPAEEATRASKPAPVAKRAGAAATSSAKSPPRRVTARSTLRTTPTASTARRTPTDSPARKLAAPAAPAVVPPLRPTTLAIDIGGTGLKASVLDAEGKLVADRVRVATPHPCPPKLLIDVLASLVAPLPSYERVSIGFPGVVRRGIILTAPHLVAKDEKPRSSAVPKVVAAWRGFDLTAALTERFGRPVRIANDADLQGLDVVSGSGLEFVVTLGTGVGTALLLDGRLAPHLELSHHPFRNGETYDEQLGDAALRRIGFKKWHKRLDEALGNFERLINYDRLYIGGGNARLLEGHVDPSVTITDNLAGILGGIKLWELPEV